MSQSTPLSRQSSIGLLATTVPKNSDYYVHGTIKVGEKRVLLTKWVGQVWEEISGNKDMICRSFRKCSIYLPINGSGDTDIHIEGLTDYTVGTEHEDETEDETEDDTEDQMKADIDDDPFEF